MLLPLNRLLLGAPPPNLSNPPAGMDLAMVGHWAAIFRKTTEGSQPPIEVTVEGEYWRTHDGRHRILGAWVAGRSFIESEMRRCDA